MSKGKRILLVSAVMLLAANGIQAGLWKSRKSQAAADPKPTASSMALSAIELGSSRVTLRTTGTPAYTSYSPAPDVFVVDLTGTVRPSDLEIPSPLPPGVLAISAEEAVEMGNRLTRVTFRFSAPFAPEVSAADKALLVLLPEFPETAVAVVSPAEEVPAPAAVVVADDAPKQEPLPVVEPVREAVQAPPLNLPKAKQVKSVATSGAGDTLRVSIHADGRVAYKAFRLDNPSRLVIDLEGVRNGVRKPTLDVNDGAVQRVRVAQFKGGVDPVARVVIDLAGKPEHAIVADGERLHVAFGTAAAALNDIPNQTITVAAVEAPRAPAPEQVKQQPVIKPAASIEEIPAVAENATWKMPPSSAAGARQVINSADDQVPPATPPRTTSPQSTTVRPLGENVFDEALTQAEPAQLSGARTLSGTQRVFTGDPISLNLKDADIKDVLRTFAQLTGLNIAVDPQVRGTVTVDFVDVPWDQALDLILRQNGLTWVLEGNVMRVGTIERLAQETAASRRLQEEERLNVPLTTLGFKLSYARATDVSGLLRDIASPRARIIVDARTNQLIISEIPQYLQTMRNLIDTVDIPNRQVVIEARVVETTKTFTRNFGFEWSFGGAFDPALGTGTGLIFPNRIGFNGGPFTFTGGANPVLGLVLTDVLGAFNLDVALHAAETEDLVRVISAPKVTTQDNTAAEIQSGIQIPYQTRVNFTTTISYIDATLRLSVTPQITEAGTIIMDIAVQKTTPGEPIEGAAGTPLATRQARTRVMVRDGGTAVIGGIYQASDSTGQSRVPVLSQIPVLGALFRSNSMRTQHDELLIFITPRIVRGT
ncbi:MAG TPA: type IV pilus secretin PilQ [Thermoanaerobaculia bacterium]|nr:type IV pilus secretin PilQ [Thermoanaerobaculia bacterium]